MSVTPVTAGRKKQKPGCGKPGFGLEGRGTHGMDWGYLLSLLDDDELVVELLVPESDFAEPPLVLLDESDLEPLSPFELPVLLLDEDVLPLFPLA